MLALLYDEFVQIGLVCVGFADNLDDDDVDLGIQFSNFHND